MLNMGSVGKENAHLVHLKEVIDLVKRNETKFEFITKEEEEECKLLCTSCVR